MPRPMTLKELRGLPDQELVRLHDQVARGNVEVGLDYYLNELDRRELQRLTEKVVTLTRVLVVLTAVLAALGAVTNVVTA